METIKIGDNGDSRDTGDNAAESLESLVSPESPEVTSVTSVTRVPQKIKDKKSTTMEKANKNTEGFIPPHGGYRKLITYQKGEIIYDGTVYFTKRFFTKFDRTVDQMVQAARSCKQNIAEASMASGTSKETEIKLTNVARASLEELMIDYEDFLRTNKLPIWDKEHRLTKRFRELNKTPNATYQTYIKAIENPEPEICANSMIGLIKIVSWLLSHQIKTLEMAFINEGGLRERMTKARIDKRNSNNNNNNNRY